MFEKTKERIANRLQPKAVVPKSAPYNVFSDRTPGVPIYTEMSTRKSVREGYKMSIYVYRAVRTIVQSASGIPWIVIDNKTGEKIDGHPFTEAWAKPNKFFSGQDNMEFIIAHLKLVGNAILQPVMVQGQPREFWVCMPDMIHPVPSKDPAKWIDGYQVQENDGTIRQQLAPREQFIHFMQFDPGNPFWGIGDLQAAARTVDTDNEAQDTQKVQLQNRNVPPGVFQLEGGLTKEQFDEANRNIKEKFGDKKKRGEPWVLGGNYKWTQMSLTPLEMDYINSRLRNLDDIATAFGLDAWWLGDKSKSMYNNTREAKLALYEIVTIPLLDDIKATLNLVVAPLYGGDITITYDLSGVTALREDYGQKVDQAVKLFSMGTPVSQCNDVLKLGLQEFPGWDESYMPFSLSPVGAMPTEPLKSMRSTKMLNMNEDQKKEHWRRIDARQTSWEPIAAKKFKAVYDAESVAVMKAVEGKEPSSMTSAASTAIKELKPKWEKTIKAVSSAVAEDFGNDTLNTLAKSAKTERKGLLFELNSPAMSAWLEEHITKSVTSIIDTEIAGAKSIIENGIKNNLTSFDISKQLRQFYDESEKWKAMRVARTEVGSASNKAQNEAAKQSGATRKVWIASMDDRVRDAHADMNGEEQGIDDAYSNGLMFPCDPDGAPGDIINCRCKQGYIV